MLILASGGEHVFVLDWRLMPIGVIQAQLLHLAMPEQMPDTLEHFGVEVPAYVAPREGEGADLCIRTEGEDRTEVATKLSRFGY